MASIQEHPRDAYFEWLVDQTGCETHRELLMLLFHIPFSASIPMDENRADDGLYFRTLYGERSDTDIDHLDGRCSMLELLMALADRLDGLTSYDHDPAYWFVYFLKQLEIYKYDDVTFNDDPYLAGLAIEHRIDIMMDHRYQYDGKGGGLFVMKNPPYDLRTIELWWQMQYWLVENYI